MFRTFQIPPSWTELIKRTIGQISKDNVLGLAAQLSFYLLLALVPAILFLVALTSFFPGHMVEQLIAQLAGVAPPAMVDLLRAQLESIAEREQGGLLTFGVLMALWSSSAAIVGAIDAMNRVYDIEEGRPWWKVRLTAISLTLALAALVIISMGLVIGGPALAEWMAAHFGLGPVFEWSWKIVQWPLVVALITVGLGLLNYYGPDAEQDWQWITPGAVLATFLWLIASLAFRLYVTNFADYNATYGALGGVIVLMLWFYISGVAVLVGSEMNAEIEHASPHGKDAGEKVPGQKRKLGAAAAREYAHQGNRPDDRQPPNRENLVQGRLPQVAQNGSFGSRLAGIPLFFGTWWFRRRTKG
jgi:membrane protein